MRAATHGRAPTVGELRRFAWTVGIAFAVLAALFLWRSRTLPASIAAAAATALVLAGMAMGLAVAMSRVTTPVFMAIVYFALLTPLGLVRRLLGHRIGVPRDASTGWVRRPPGATRSDLTRQF